MRSITSVIPTATAPTLTRRWVPRWPERGALSVQTERESIQAIVSGITGPMPPSSRSNRTPAWPSFLLVRSLALVSRLVNLFIATGNVPGQSGVRRGKSLLGREKDNPESGLAQFKRRTTLSRRKSQTHGAPSTPSDDKKNGRFFDNIAPGPKDAWMIYCWILTCCVPPFLLNTCGAFRFILFVTTFLLLGCIHVAVGISNALYLPFPANQKRSYHIAQFLTALFLFVACAC